MSNTTIRINGMAFNPQTSDIWTLDKLSSSMLLIIDVVSRERLFALSLSRHVSHASLVQPSGLLARRSNLQNVRNWTLDKFSSSMLLFVDVISRERFLLCLCRTTCNMMRAGATRNMWFWKKALRWDPSRSSA
jgi:hypothetical protein